MCGIFGITEKNEKIIKQSLNLTSYRGPDYKSVWSDDHITLGHNLLSITSSPENGKQPWVTENNNILIYNGEIFNYYDLIKQFKGKFNPKTSCDTELLAWLLENKSLEDINDKILDSMHAFAFYNLKERTLILSRDHAGIKPLFFSEISSGIIFGSEIKGISPYVSGSNIIDRLALACTGFVGFNLLRQTLFSKILKILPGETLVYDLNSKKIKKFYRTYTKPLSNYKYEPEEFFQETEQAIERSTIGIRKFGMFLSGGIDSSLIAKTLKNKLGNLDTFTNYIYPNEIINNEDHNSDAEVAKLFSEDCSMNHHEIKITPSIVNNVWDESIKFMEEPRYNWNMPMYYFTNKILAENDVVVTMSGDMGDELFGGYDKYYYIKELENKPKTWEEFIWIWMHKFKSPIKLNMKVNVKDIHKILCQVLPREIWNPDDIVNSMMALDSITVVTEDFFTRNDRYGMVFSMEGRFPFASKKFMRYCYSIPSNEKIGKTPDAKKLVVKNAYKKFLPDYILNKYKTGWSVPTQTWILNNQLIKSKYHETISKDDGISEIITDSNYKSAGKQQIIAWMLRTWAQQYSMTI